MQIAFVAYPGFTALDLVGPVEVLSRIPGVRSEVVAAAPGAITADTGALSLNAPRDLGDVPAPEVIVVPGGLAGSLRAAADPSLRSWLQQAAPSAGWVTSVCTGSLVLGAAGLLEGRRATTHWVMLDKLASYGATPAAERVVVDGHVVTAAGVSAGIDMALWLAGQLAGEDVARLLQLAIEYEPDPPYDAGSPARAGQRLSELSRALLEQAFAEPIPTASS